MVPLLTADDDGGDVGGGVEKEDGRRRLVRECVMNARAPNTSPNQLTASTHQRPPDPFL